MCRHLWRKLSQLKYYEISQKGPAVSLEGHPKLVAMFLKQLIHQSRWTQEKWITMSQFTIDCAQESQDEILQQWPLYYGLFILKFTNLFKACQLACESIEVFTKGHFCSRIFVGDIANWYSQCGKQSGAFTNSYMLDCIGKVEMSMGNWFLWSWV